ncbi:hypothetical protein LEP1GSC050_4113 [Leptospira broomii serovar Hurstbridge str. 5399]|uniref:Uncharacterized protein n=1 Tax=Leptospira broomii serovar Hurstbridge str. 5399 TaxID=1049789 RepID=T0GG29_9LEPT|nr:hypothetical protein [Leptospira broomii]EQA44353.1 hypothetical protein LEP1GSC050_4113 [Leptospira broomii serovar Hurstbridge str. 5399]
MELIEEMDKEKIAEGFWISRPDGVNIGIEKITFSFPIEDIEKIGLDRISKPDKEIPEHSKIDVQVKGRKVYITYPFAQLSHGFYLPGDFLEDIKYCIMDLESDVKMQKGCVIQSFDNMEIEKLHLIQAVAIECDDLEDFQLLEWLNGRYNGEFHKLEETEDLINGGKVRRIMKTFYEKEESHWKTLANEMYQVEFSVVLENAQSIKEALGEIYLEALNIDNLKKVMQQNAKVFFNSLGYIHPLVRILESLDVIDQEMGSVWRRAASMKYPDNYERHFPEMYHDTVEIYEENVKNLKELRRFINYLTRGIVDPVGGSNSILKSIDRLGKELVGPEFSFELRY